MTQSGQTEKNVVQSLVARLLWSMSGPLELSNPEASFLAGAEELLPQQWMVCLYLDFLAARGILSRKGVR